ncbi:MAG: hypothetical protein ACI9VR_001528 [Cognaticolwellia sp.]|jgi:hypothetical protein
MSLVLFLALTACRTDSGTAQDTASIVKDTGTDDTQVEPIDADNDGYAEDVDCDDTDAAVYPDAEEICDDVDNNCDGEIDEGLLLELFIDRDGDGYGDSEQPTTACGVFEGLSETEGDCDDAEALANPGLEEICSDHIDNDCDGTSNECAPAGPLNTDSALYGLTSSQQNDVLGWEVSGSIDMDGDGLGEVLLGALYGSRDSANAGAAYLIRGQPSGISEVTESADATMTSTVERDFLGAALRGGVDLNADGQLDWVVGAPGDISGHTGQAYEDRGEVLIFSGDAAGSQDAREAALIRIQGHTPGMHAGYAVAISDLGGPALALGAYEDSTQAEGAGAVYLFTSALPSEVGAELSTQDADAVLVAVETLDHLGVAVSLDDLNGDGVADLMAGGPGRIWEDSENAESEQGTLAWLMGPVSGTVLVSDADGALLGDPKDSLGYAFSTGDMDGDGYVDLAVGAYNANDGVGGAYVFAGPISGDLNTADAIARLTGEAEEDQAGATVDMSQDMDGDGKADLLVGAWAWPGGQGYGQVYFLPGPLSGDGDLVDARATWTHEESLSAFGFPVHYVPDTNGDAIPDVVVGASYSSSVASYGGAAWVFAGSGL